MSTDLFLYFGLFIISLSVLLKASDWFVDSAEEIGLSFGISPYIVGITIVACGTSLPELATSIASVDAGNSEIVVGNVVGSNITNILLILGIVAIMSRGGIRVEGQMIMEIDIPLLVCSAFLLWFMLTDGSLSLVESFILMGGMVIFLVHAMKTGKTEKTEEAKTTWKTWAMLLFGGVLVYFGADFTIYSISKLSVHAGIPQQVIAVTLVALGTSLPELVVSVAAARKGKASMAIGNVMGSNIFNTYMVMSLPRLLGDLTIPADIIQFSLPFMVGITVVFTVISIMNRIPRPAGAMMLLFYVFFLLKVF